MTKIIFIMMCLSGGLMAVDVMKFNKNRLFEVIVDRLETILETPEYAEWHYRIKKMNKTRAVVGNILLRQPILNDDTMELKFLRKQGGEYRYLAYGIPRLPICEALKKDIYFYPDLAKASNLPEDIENNCPLAAGNYSTDGYIFKTDNFPEVVVQSGEYCAEVIIYHNGQHTGTYRVFAYINKI